MSGTTKIKAADGLVRTPLLPPDAQTLAPAFHFEAMNDGLAALHTEAREAVTIARADDSLSRKGLDARLGDMSRLSSEEALARASKPVNALVQRLESDAAKYADGPVLLGDLVADHKLDPRDPRRDAAGLEVFDQLHRTRSAMESMPGPALRELLERSALEGDSLVLAALDGLPRVIRESLEKRAGLDSDAASALRRSYRIARHPELARELQALGQLAAQVSRNARFAFERLREFGLTPPREARTKLDAMLAPLAKLVKAATGTTI